MILEHTSKGLSWAGITTFMEASSLQKKLFMTQNEGRRNNSQSGLAERIVHDDTNSFGLRRKFEMIIELVDSPEIAVEVPPLPLSGEKRSITQGDATPENKNVTASADDGDAQRQPHGHH